MDLSQTIAPKSDQLDAVDLLSGPRTFTVESVSGGSSEQPINIKLREFPRPWRPGKSMRRVLVSAWGGDGTQYAGRRLTLFCDTSVVFAGVEVGGVRISHLSHIDRPWKVPLIVTRGKSAVYVVEPLVESADTQIASLRSEWKSATDERKAAIEAEVNALSVEGDVS